MGPGGVVAVRAGSKRLSLVVSKPDADPHTRCRIARSDRAIQRGESSRRRFSTPQCKSRAPRAPPHTGLAKWIAARVNMG
ncbi:hypothetical protein FM113_17225 [Leucobacter sp. 7(1)]|nr:hypothetical protein FM113_17225 [Leucobacter sp. 7(1)]